MSKIIIKKVDNCYDCLYCKYNGDYGRSYDSGFDCEELGIRLVDDGELNKYNNDIFLWGQSQKTLFPIPKEERPKNPFEIPDECPLEDWTKDDLK